MRRAWSLDRPFVVVVVIAAMLLPACATGQAKARHQTLIAEMAFNLDDLDTARGSSTTTIVIDKSVYDTLTTVNPHDLSKPYPSLATSWTVSPDGKTTTFHLRHGVKFASGNPLTSADVVWSLTRLGVVGIASGMNITVDGLTASAPDPYTVVITASAPDPAVAVKMAIVNASILDSVLVKQHGGTTGKNDQADNFLNSSSAGSGPYMFESVDRVNQVVLKANPNYWGPKPTYDTVILRNAPPATQRFDIQDGQAQLALDIPAGDATSLNSSVNVLSAPSADELFVALNADPSVLKWGANQNFRDAVRYGLDYQGLIALAGKGAVQATGYIPDGILGSLPIADAPHRDLARAKTDLMLAESEVGAGTPTVELDYPTDHPLDGISLTIYATAIQADLEQVGITVNLVGKPNTIYQAYWESGKTQMFLSKNSADFPDPVDFAAYTIGAGNDASFGANWVTGMDPSIDALTATANSTIQPAARDAAYQALEKAMNAKAYFDFLLNPSRTLVEAKSVHATINPFTFVDFGSIT